MLASYCTAMTDQDRRIRTLEDRVSRLEQQLASGKTPASRPRPPRRPIASLTSGPSARRLVEFVAGEGALARIGIGLLLFGVLWLVRYSIDEGWLDEWARVLLAASAGLVLLGFGRYLRGSGRVLSQILLGGGIGALYMAGFSAYAFYGLVSFQMALGLVSAVTILCFALSLSEDSHTLASIAAAAGLSTPFLLDSGEGSVAGLSAYILVVQFAVAAVYRVRAWGSTVLVAGVLTMLTLVLAGIKLEADAALYDRIWMQLAVAGALAVYGILPALRPGSSSGSVSRILTQAMAGVAPMAAWLLSVIAWDLGQWPQTFLAVAFSIAWLIPIVRWDGGSYLNSIALFGASAMAAIAVFSATDGNGAGLLPVVALVLHYLASREKESQESSKFESGTWIAPLFLLMGLLILTGRLLDAPDSRYYWPSAIYDGAGVLAMAACARWSAFPRLLKFASWALVLLYLQREFGHLGDLTGVGPATVTSAWAVLAIFLLGAGRRARSDDYRYVGMITVGLVVFKLIFFDLDQLDPVWKILIPVGIGAALLLMSYVFPSWWRGEEADLRPPPGNPGAGGQ
jgi:uncharacterized membrane protein